MEAPRVMRRTDRPDLLDNSTASMRVPSASAPKGSRLASAAAPTCNPSVRDAPTSGVRDPIVNRLMHAPLENVQREFRRRRLPQPIAQRHSERIRFDLEDVAFRGLDSIGE